MYTKNDDKFIEVRQNFRPKGLMPNPKLGTVTENIEEAVKSAKAGQVEIKNDKDGNIGVSLGKNLLQMTRFY